jgi:1-acyl-sn-glycerol-3-phosphate acyltransferase
MIHESEFRVPWFPRGGPERGSETTANAESALSDIILRGLHWMTGIHARWLGCGPTDARRIYFANHTSHLDAVLLWAALPDRLRKKTRPVAAADYWKPVAWRRYLAERVFRSVFVERNSQDPAVTKTAPLLEALDHGDSLILFPEGTRGNGAELQPFKAGVFHIAHDRPGIELVPVWLDNCYQVLPKGAILPLPLLCTATFGPPVQIDAKEEKAGFLQRLRQGLLDLRKA